MNGLETGNKNKAAFEDDALVKILNDIEALTISRKRALNNACDWLLSKPITEFEFPGYAEKTIDKINLSFEKAGLFSINTDDFICHCAARKNKLSTEPEPPLSIQRLFACKQMIVSALSSLENELVSVGIAQTDSLPWEPEIWSKDQAIKSDLVLFAYRGEWSQNPCLGCIALGSVNASYLEMALDAPKSSKMLQMDIWNKPDISMLSVMNSLKALRNAVQEFNFTSNLINDKFFEISLIQDQSKVFEVKWNGKVIEHTTKLSNTVQPSSIEKESTDETIDSFLISSIN